MLISINIGFDGFYILNDVLTDEEIILSNSSYNNIYIYSLKNKLLKNIGEFNGFNISLSKDRKKILLRNNGRILLLTTDGKYKILAEEGEKVGYPVWYNELVAYTCEGKINIVDTNGVKKGEIKGVNSYFISTNGKIFAFQENDKIYIIDENGNKELITPGDGIFYGPTFSLDGSMIIFNSVGEGIFLYNILEKKTYFVSEGFNPRFSNDSKKIVFNISRDDGERIISSEIYIYDIEKRKIEKITDTPDINEIKPIFSLDGKKIFYSLTDGRIGFIEI